MTKLPVLKSEELVACLTRNGFDVIRQKGSHVRMKHPDGRVVTVPVHPGQDIGRGLLRKILRDAELSIDKLLTA
jgi:predicted RNA binding protein YcfA (HicA-like mRNA interferase family)